MDELLTLKTEIESLKQQLDQSKQIINERFNKMGSAFMDLKQETSRPKYVVPSYCSPITNDLDAAHAMALKDLRCVPRDAKGQRGAYAKVEHIAQYVNPIIGAYGLSIKQVISHNEYNERILITRLSHSSGQYVESRVTLINDTDRITNQSFGASNTYMRRYAFLAILGIGAIDDPSDTIE